MTEFFSCQINKHILKKVRKTRSENILFSDKINKYRSFLFNVFSLMDKMVKVYDFHNQILNKQISND